MPTVADIFIAVDRLAPLRLAESWDNVGLIFGDRAWPVRRVLVALAVGEAVVLEAERIGADLLFVHHPPIFKPVTRLTDETRAGRLALQLLAARRAVIAAHTNLDGAPGGLCDILGRMAGLEDLRPLEPVLVAKQYKVVVFVPESAVEAVRAAAFAAGAGRIGLYSECTFTASGTGTFLPGPGTNCAAGEAGRRNAMAELRLEFPVAESQLGGVLAAVGRAHPYEMPAVDVYPLRQEFSADGGAGRVGRLKELSTAADLADKIKRAMGLQAISLAGDPARRVERVAIVTGAGGGCIDSVLASGVQAFITGELRLHEVQQMVAAGVAVILGGHHATERVPLDAWAPRLAAELPDIEVVLSRDEKDPTQLV
jgi:dinuclear metal center YbgI/SA1388 family protein